MEDTKVLRMFKSVGITPLELLNQLRRDRPELANEKLAYAGRLDPMAEGEMLILIGDECLNRKRYEQLDKEYEFEVLFGISTDTYDVLGKITKYDFGLSKQSEKSISQILTSFISKHEQAYPPFSSPRIKGKSLWWWAKENRLAEIEIPKKEIEVYDLKLLALESKLFNKIHDKIVQKIKLVNGSFRQDKILELWEDLNVTHTNIEVQIAKFKVSCSSGTYVRSLVKEIGEKLNIPTVTYSIKRTQIILR